MASARWNALRNGSYRDLLPAVGTTDDDASAGSKMWDKLLSATGSVSKAVSQKIRDVAGSDDAESDGDEEGVDTHVIRSLRQYYMTKGRSMPPWLQTARYQEQATSVRSDSPAIRASSQRHISERPGNPQKVSLKNIYERAQSQEQQAPRRTYSSARSTLSRQQGSVADERGEAPAPLSSDRFRERVRINRIATDSGSFGHEPASMSRTSADLPRPETGASQLRRGLPGRQRF